MTAPIQGRYVLRCSSCKAQVYLSDTGPPVDQRAELTRFADEQCPRGGTAGGCPNTTEAREEVAERSPTRLVARLREAWEQIQQWAERGQQTIADVRALEVRQPRTVLVPVPSLPAGRHDIPVVWPRELPAAPRVQVTPEVPRVGVAAVRVAVLAGSRSVTGCTVVVDLAADVTEGQAWLHVTATP